MKLFLFTTDPVLAKDAEISGIHSLIVDWESKGKTDRQAGHDLEINLDTPQDIRNLKETVSLPITVRINPLDKETPNEVDIALEAGADILMLPMAKTAEQVETFLKIVAQRAKTLIQIETQDLVDDILAFSTLPWDYAYIGLNDLMLSRCGNYIWEPLVDGTVENVFSHLKGREYGFGGATIVGGGSPIPCDLLLGEYDRLGCSVTFMRRTFKKEVAGKDRVLEMTEIHSAIVEKQERSEKEKQMDAEILRATLADEYQKKIVLMYSTHAPTQEHLNQLKKIAPHHQVVVATSQQEAVLHAPKTEIILGHRYLSQVLPHAKQLRWVQTTAGGVDRLPLQELLDMKCMLTRSTTASRAVAAHAVKLLKKVSQQTKTRFNNKKRPVAYILGFGQIGESIAKMIHTEFTVVGVRRDKSKKCQYCSKMLGSNEWQSQIQDADVIFISLPLKNDTKHAISAEVIDSLSKKCLILNVGRGDTIDEEYLEEALVQNNIGGYATDVLGTYFTQEILSGLQEKTNKIVHTPYIAAQHHTRAADLEVFIEDQLDRYVHNTELVNRVTIEEFLL